MKITKELPFSGGPGSGKSYFPPKNHVVSAAANESPAANSAAKDMFIALKAIIDATRDVKGVDIPMSMVRAMDMAYAAVNRAEQESPQ